ncbi:WUSCHEL protein [Spatholobus suberectus]|nr:WUSCHEL protein [Spatholobus suberectus]
MTIIDTLCWARTQGYLGKGYISYSMTCAGGFGMNIARLKKQEKRSMRSPSAEQSQRISARLRQYEISSVSSFAEMVTVGQMRNSGYGSVPMEKSFRDCSTSARGCSGLVGINHNLGWDGVDLYSSAYANFFDKIRPTENTLE